MAESKPFRFGTTFAERRAAREGRVVEVEDVKQVDAETAEVEDKAVAPKKTSAKRSRKG